MPVQLCNVHLSCMTNISVCDCIHFPLQGIQKYEFDMYLDLHKLLHGKLDEITHKFVKKWKTFNDLVTYAKKVDDVSLINKLKAILYIIVPYTHTHTHIAYSFVHITIILRGVCCKNNYICVCTIFINK